MVESDVVELRESLETRHRNRALAALVRTEHRRLELLRAALLDVAVDEVPARLASLGLVFVPPQQTA